MPSGASDSSAHFFGGYFRVMLDVVLVFQEGKWGLKYVIFTSANMRTHGRTQLEGLKDLIFNAALCSIHTYPLLDAFFREQTSQFVQKEFGQ